MSRTLGTQCLQIRPGWRGLSYGHNPSRRYGFAAVSLCFKTKRVGMEGRNRRYLQVVTSARSPSPFLHLRLLQVRVYSMAVAEPDLAPTGVKASSRQWRPAEARRAEVSRTLQRSQPCSCFGQEAAVSRARLKTQRRTLIDVVLVCSLIGDTAPAQVSTKVVIYLLR